MKNRPYEKDRPVITPILATTAVVGLGAVGVHAMLHPKEAKEAADKIMDKVMPRKYSDPNIVDTIGARKHTSFAQGQAIATASNRILRKKKAEQFRAKKAASGLSSLSLSQEDILAIEKNIPSIKTLTHTGGRVRNMTGQDVTDRLFTALQNLGITKVDEHTVAGTTLKFRARVEGSSSLSDFAIDIPVWDPETKTMVSLVNGETAYSSPLAYKKYTVKKGKINQVSFVDPVQHVIETLESPGRVLLEMNKGKHDIDRVIEEFYLPNRKRFRGMKPGLKRNRLIEEELGIFLKEAGISQAAISGLPRGTRDLQDFIRKITFEKGEYYAANNQGGIQRAGKVVVDDVFSRIVAGENNSAVSVTRAMSIGENKEKRSLGEKIITYLKERPVETREFVDKGLARYNGRTEATINQNDWFMSIRNGAFVFNGNANDASKGTLSMIATPSNYEQLENMKGLSQQVRFSTKNNPARRWFTKPIIQNKELFETYEHVFDMDVLGVTALVTPEISEQIMLKDFLYKNAVAESPKQYTLDKVSSATADVYLKNGEVKPLSIKEFYENLKDPEFFRDVEMISWDKGTTAGFKANAEYATDADELMRMLAEGETGKLQTTGSRIIQYRKDIEKSISMTLDAQKNGNDSVVLLGHLHEDASKISAMNLKARNNIEKLSSFMSKRLNRVTRAIGRTGGKNIGVGAYISADFFKNIFTKGLTVDNGGKNLTELTQTLISFAAGGIDVSRGMLFKREALKKYIDKGMLVGVGDGETINLRSALRKGAYFDLRAERVAPQEHLEFAQLLAGTVHQARQDMAKSKNPTFTIDSLLDLDNSAKVLEQAIGENFDYDKHRALISKLENAKTIEEEREVLSKLLFSRMDTIANTQETRATGAGTNIIKFGLREMWMLNPETTKVLAAGNIVNSQAIMSEGQAVMASLAEQDLYDFLPKGYKPVELFSQEAIHEFTSNATRSGNFTREIGTDLNLFFDTLGSEKNKHGALVKYFADEAGTKTGVAMIGGREFFQGVTFIGEKDQIARDPNLRAATDLLQAAAENEEGIVPYEDWIKYQARMIEENNSAKTGFMGAGRIHVRGGIYGLNKGGSAFLNNEQILRNIKDFELANNTIGNLLYTSRKTFIETQMQHIEDSIDVAGAFKNDPLGRLKEIYGKDSEIVQRSQAYLEANGEINSKKIAKSWANDLEQLRIDMEKSVQKYSVLNEAKTAAEAAGQTYGKMSEWEAQRLEVIKMMNTVRSKAVVAVVGRDPHVYPKSITEGLGLPNSQLDRGVDSKSYSAGHIIRVVENLDHDGDAISIYFNNSKASRIYALNEIDTTVKQNAEILTRLKESKFNPFEGREISKAWRLPHSAEELSKLDKLTRAMEWQTAIGSFLTKGFTGSADVSARGMQAYFKEKLMAGGLTEQELKKSENFISSFIPLEYLQNVISGKKFSVSEGASGEIESMLTKMLAGVNTLTKEELFEHIINSEGIDSISVFGLARASTDSANKTWLNEAMPHLNKVFLTQSNLKKVKGEELENALKYLGATEELAKDRRVAYEAFIEKPENKPLYEYFGVHEKAQIELPDILEAVASQKKDLEDVILTTNRFLSKAKKGTSVGDAISAAILWSQSNRGAMSNEGMTTFTGVTSQRSRRVLAGFDSLEKFGKWLGEGGPVRIAGAVGLGMAGLMGINAILGDGAPVNYNDVPSVNNPSFQDSRYSPQIDQRSYANYGHGNISTSLLTDSLTPSQTVLDHLSNTFGNHYSTISYREDRRDPYSDVTFKYSM